MTIDQKINFRANSWYHLEFNQYCQLIELKRLILAPYYRERLLRQLRQVQDNENFKNTFGGYRWELENGLI